MATALDLDDLTRRAAATGGAALHDLARLPVGESSITLTGTLRQAEVDERVVVKVAPPGLPPVRNRDVLRQAAVQRALQGHGVPVPRILFEDAGDPPAIPPFFVMEHVDGDSVDPAWGRDPVLPADLVHERGQALVSALGRLHAVDPALLAWPEPALTIEDEVRRWSRALQTADDDVREGADACTAALLGRLPSATPARVTHGDFRLGNCLWDGARLACIVDWELWAVSDPRLDLAFILLSFDPSRPAPWRPAPGMPTPAEVLEGYCAALPGAEVDALDWFSAAARHKVAASLALLVKFNRRRAESDPLIEAAAHAARTFLAEARALLS